MQSAQSPWNSRLPPALRPAGANAHYDMEEADNLVQRSAMNFRDQREVLLDVPRKQDESSVQLYFW